jgi:hypothetical protein
MGHSEADYDLVTLSSHASDLDPFVLSDDDEVEIKVKGGLSTRRKGRRIQVECPGALECGM